MRKILLLAALAIGIASCQKEDAALIATGKIKFTPIVEKSLDFTKKSTVNRADVVPVYVETIDVTTNGVTGAINTTFQMVDNGGVDAFIIENLPLGETEITAKTTTNSTEAHMMMPFSDVNEAVNYAKSMNPYVIYSSISPVIVELIHEQVATANVDMATDNGRVYMTFAPETADLFNDFDIKVTANNSVESLSSSLTAANPVSLYYWSDKNAVNASQTEITIEWFAKGETAALRTETFVVDIEAGTSYKYNIIIANSSVEQAKVGLTFSFTPVEEIDGGDIVFGGEGAKTMEEIAVADWDLTNGTFIAESGEAFVWQRGETNGAYNLAAAVYYSADWNPELKELARNSVISNIVVDNAPRGWDLLIYDNYASSDVLDAWMSVYADNNVVKPEKLRNTYYYYDAIGVVIGLYRAKEAGFLTQAKYDESISVATARIAELGGITENYQHAFFKLIYEETGETLGVTPNTSINVADMTDAQDLGFAARAYGVAGINDMTEQELRVALLEAAQNTNYSLSSNDAINGYYSL